MLKNAIKKRRYRPVDIDQIETGWTEEVPHTHYVETELDIAGGTDNAAEETAIEKTEVGHELENEDEIVEDTEAEPPHAVKDDSNEDETMDEDKEDIAVAGKERQPLELPDTAAKIGRTVKKKNIMK